MSSGVNLGERLRVTTQPVAWAVAVKAVAAVLVLLGVVELTGEQVAGLGIAVEAVFGLLVWSQVTPNANAEARAVDAADQREVQVVADLRELAAAEPAKPVKKAAPKAGPAKR